MRHQHANLPSKRRLIVWVIACQAICLAGGMAATLSWMRSATGAAIQSAAGGPSSAAENALDPFQRSQDLQAAVDQALTPTYRFGMFLIAIMTLGAIGMSGWMMRDFHKRMVQINEGLEQIVFQRTQDLTRTRDAVIAGLAQLAEFRDQATGRHLQRVGSYVEVLARCLRQEEPQRYPMINDAWIHDVVVASALHDIGKVGIPDYILHKDGPLNANEKAMIEDHPIIGGECIQLMEKELGDSSLLTLAREIAYSHHDWWDGTGYPFKQEGENIPLSARIVALADVYDALTTARSYKSAMSHHRASEIIFSGMAKQFDPYVVGAFRLREKEFEAIAREMSRSDLERDDEHEVQNETMDPVALDRLQTIR